MPATYEPIVTTTLTSASDNITFSNIPGTYTDLKLISVFQNTTSAADTWLTINGVQTGNLYSCTVVEGTGSAAASSRQSSINRGIPFTQTGATVSPYWTYSSIDLFSYTGSTNKSLLVSTNQDKNGSGQVQYYVGLYRSTSAITSLSINYATGNLSIGTIVTLYGIKAA